MAESQLLEKFVAKVNGKNKLMKQFMDAIYYINKDRCDELLSEFNVRQINHVVRLKYPGYVGYTVTPLIWAVMNNLCDVAEMLLLHHAKVDKVGTYENSITLYTTSPLLEAVKNLNSKMVKLLVDKGAPVQVGVPGPRSEEEEGGSIQYDTYLIPLNLGLGAGIDIYRCLLDHADIASEFGPGRHTCLCFALKHYLSDEMSSDIQYILEVLHRGGGFCRGKGDNSTSTGNDVCVHLQTFIWNVVPPLMMVNESKWSFNYEYFHCLKLICCTDYSHKSSQFYRACRGCVQECRNYLAGVQLDNDSDLVKDCISWIIGYSESPSSLQHICRVTVRNLVKPFSLQQCKQLSLPEKLLRFIMLEDC